MKKTKLEYPKVLNRDDLFRCPVWYADAPEFVKNLNKASDKHIDESKKNMQKELKKQSKNIGDLGKVYHSGSLSNDPKFKEITNYIGATANNLLIEMGFDLTNFLLYTTEMWVQEFAKKGGGHHTLHTHWNGHISGFYFLKASDKTSMPIFEDPRPGNLMNLLPEADKTKITFASSMIHYRVKPGRFMFFPSYMPHQYSVDLGQEPFRFMHFNCQAIPKSVLNAK